MTQSAVGLVLSAIDQISISVTDLDVAERFYCAVLGLRLADSAPPSMRFFGCGGVNLIATKSEKISPASIIYFKVDGIPGRIQEKFAALRAAGVVVEDDPNCIARNWHGNDIWLAFFRDPFGNLLALKSDVPVESTATITQPRVRIENTIPILCVRDLRASVAFYQEKLGFKLDWGGVDLMGSVSRDGHPIILRQKVSGISPTEIWIGCGDAVQVYTQCKQAGVTLIQPPTNQHFAVEMRVADLDGNVLWFGSEPRTDIPFGAKI